MLDKLLKFLGIEKKYSKEEVKVLVEEIKKFNAGVIDPYLSKHVDEVFEKWIK